jgi:predicted TIM-barrel fold metal-dependent hydrolase
MSPLPEGIGVVDPYIGFPDTKAGRIVDRYRDVLKDADSQSMTTHPAEYMFKDVPPPISEDDDPVATTLAEMDRYGIEFGIISLGFDVAARALAEHPDRFRATTNVDPKDITGAVRQIRAAAAEYPLHAVTSFPAGVQVAIGDRRYYPIFQTCIDVDVPIILNAGVAGPRFPSAEIQYVGQFDQVCYDFPELRIVMCHGAEPWEELATKLMLKWPGLYYAPSAFVPKHYPKAIIDFANTRGADKILYAGYYPMGITLERIFRELPDVPFRDHVWPKFLRENAMSVFKLDEDRRPKAAAEPLATAESAA